MTTVLNESRHGVKPSTFVPSETTYTMRLITVVLGEIPCVPSETTCVMKVMTIVLKESARVLNAIPCMVKLITCVLSDIPYVLKLTMLGIEEIPTVMKQTTAGESRELGIDDLEATPGNSARKAGRQELPAFAYCGARSPGRGSRVPQDVQNAPAAGVTELQAGQVVDDSVRAALI